ncbi:hypothetical protein DYH09_16405 [bacterium CPR1]|nr:hypothetical protein [bacterium CPR1]
MRDFFTRVLAAGGYEVRSAQLEMATAVARALVDQEVLVVEAGTGTGKSLGYLVPAFLFLEETEGPVVVSTRTINLQQQLLEHDLPRLAGFLERDYQVVLAKGWSNYACLRRFDQLDELEPAEQAALEQIRPRLSRTGERQQLRLSDELWSHVVADPLACSRQACPHFQDCYFFKARRALEQADVIVTNHALLLADLNLRLGGAQGVLPEYHYLVLDEAHHLEEVATEHLGQGASRHGLELLLQRLYRPRARSAETGLLASIRARVVRSGLDAELARELLKQIDYQLLARVIDLRELSERLGNAAAALAGGSEGRYRLKRSFPGSLAESELHQAGLALVQELRHWCTMLHHVQNTMLTSEAWTLQDPGSSELAGALSRLDSTVRTLEFCLFPDSDHWIYWAQAGKRDAGVAAAPLDVSRILSQELYPRMRTVVMTSATLAVGGQTGFFERRVGLDAVSDRVARMLLDSPFEYPQQVFLGLASDLGEVSSEGFVSRALPGLLRLAQALAGRTFLLVTSWLQLQQFARQLRPRLAEMGIELLAQGDLPSAQLVQRFRSHGRALLVGTDSFWEGVDVPGDALRCVVLARLPFRAPTDPVVEARSCALETEGFSAFEFLQLPLAILKLRQGFGRLIRTTSDRGLVYLLDPRVQTRQYGPRFLQSLPRCTRIAGAFEDLVEEGLEWLFISKPWGGGGSSGFETNSP